MLYSLMRSQAEVRVLGVVLFSDGLHLREIARRARVSPAEAKRELDILLSIGLLYRETRGNQTLFSANQSCPFLPELKSLYQKTEGFHAVLRKAFSGLGGVSYAFIYGSAAGGKMRANSDVDLLVVGAVAEEALSSAVLKAQRKCGCEINYILWSDNDLGRKLREGGAFVTSILENPRQWLAGDEPGFEGIAFEALRGKGAARRKAR
ncbi:MAG: nucleotidyltransferase domain-containing protein [Candidatus Micrarchaeota archaeon]